MSYSDYLIRQKYTHLRNQINNQQISDTSYQSSKLVVLILNDHVLDRLNQSKLTKSIQNLYSQNKNTDTFVSVISLGNGYNILIEPICLDNHHLLMEYLMYVHLILPTSIINHDISEVISQIKNHKTTSNKINKFNNLSIITLEN